MKIELIAVGSETQYRNHFDTAYQYLRREASSVGAEIGNYRILRTDPTDLFAALKASMQSSEAVLLLAAPDPASVQTILKVVCAGLELPCTTDPTLERQVQQRASHLDQSLTYEQMASFATFPKGASVLRNPGGLVQGYAIMAKKQMLLVLPAVPSELSSLFSSEVRPLLAGRTGLSASYGMARVLEADSFSVIHEIERLNENPKLHLSCQQNCGDYEIYIEAMGPTQEAASQLKDTAIARLRDRFGICLYCIGNQTLPAIVVDRMAKTGLTLSSAEMGTSGALQSQLSDTWGAGSFYRMCCGEQEILHDMHLPHKLISESAGCSAALAATIAVQCRKMGKTSLGVGICCRPAQPGSSERSRLIVAIADKRKIWTKRLEVPENRTPEQVAQLAVWQALNMIRLYAAQYPNPLPGGTDVSSVDKRLSGLPVLFSHKKSVSRTAPHSTSSGAETGKIDVKENGNMKSSYPQPAPRASAASADRGTNLIQRLKAHRMTKSDKLRLILLGFCVLVFIACMVYIGSVKLESVNNAKKSEELAGLYGSDVGNVEGYPTDYIKGFEALYELNPDISGWISIENTGLNYAVVQADDNKKYDRTDFYGKVNQHGVPFVDFRVDLAKPSFNTIIYAHNMGDGQMFGELTNYKKLTYYQAHPTINFNSVYREGQYKIFAIVICKANDDSFSYHNFIDSGSSTEKDQYLQKVLERSIIKTTVDVKNTDSLLTLSTCDYSFRDPDTNKLIARLVVFARAVRPGESTSVNTDGSVLNSNPVMPSEWYEYIKKQQDKKEAEALEKEQKAYIDLWLTDAEKTGTVAEQYALAQTRAAEAEQYLTNTELSSGMKPDEILESINYRKKLFTLLISEQEASLSANNKVTLCDERAKLLGKYFTDEELWKIGKWATLEERYKVISSDADILRYLTTVEIKDTTAVSTVQIALVNERKAEAAKYLTSDQINACATWSDLSAKINEAKATRKTYEDQAKAAGLTQEEINKMSLAELKAAVDKKLNQTKINAAIAQIQVLNKDATGTNGQKLSEMSLEDLNALLATLQNERKSLESAARKYGMSDADIAKQISNADLSASITAQRGIYDKLIADILAAYPGKTTQADLEAMTYAQLLEKQAALAKAATEPTTPATPTDPATPTNPTTPTTVTEPTGGESSGT